MDTGVPEASAAARREAAAAPAGGACARGGGVAGSVCRAAACDVRLGVLTAAA